MERPDAPDVRLDLADALHETAERVLRLARLAPAVVAPASRARDIASWAARDPAASQARVLAEAASALRHVEAAMQAAGAALRQDVLPLARPVARAGRRG